MFLARGATEPLSPFMSVHHASSRISSLVCSLARLLPKTSTRTGRVQDRGARIIRPPLAAIQYNGVKKNRKYAGHWSLTSRDVGS